MCRVQSIARPTASEQRGNSLKSFKDFSLKANTRFWPSLSYMCHIRSTAVAVALGPALVQHHLPIALASRGLFPDPPPPPNVFSLNLAACSRVCGGLHIYWISDHRGVAFSSQLGGKEKGLYRGTSLIRNCHRLGPYSRRVPRNLRWY